MLRLADYSNIEKYSVQGNVLKIIPQKTKDKSAAVYVPIHPQLRRILMKYDNKIPRIKNIQDFNRKLKEISELAEIDQDEEIRTWSCL